MNRFAEDIGVFLKGAAMGAANVIPGVSGGTIAFITGIYERLINALKSFDLEALKLLKSMRIVDFLKHIDFRFLFALGLGVVVSILTLAKFLEWAFGEHPVLVWAFFFGLILASIYFVGKMVGRWSPAAILFLVLGAGIATGIAFLKPASENDAFVYMILCGIVAISSMIIPGLSGSFVLLLMGNYILVLGAVGDRDIPLLIPFGIGCVVGLLVFSHLLSWVFRRYHDIAVALITGFIVGSLLIIWPWKDDVFKTDEAGSYLVKNGERQVEARGTDLSAVQASLSEEKEEELVNAGYENWHLPSFSDKTTVPGLVLIFLGAFSVWLIEYLGMRFGRKPSSAAATQ